METIRKKIILPKLPPLVYKLTRKKFKRVIKKYPIEIRNIFLKRYNAISSALKKRQREDGSFIPGGVLSDYQKIFVIELKSRFYTNKQILKVVHEEWKLEYSTTALYTLFKRNNEIIEKKRFNYTTDLDSLRFVHEKSRIEELSDLFEKAKSDDDRNIMITTLKEIRQEVKGDKLVIDNNINANININVKQQILSEVDIEIFGQLAILKILSKHNIDFSSLAHRLKKREILEDPETGEKINKVLPIDVEGTGLVKSTKISSVEEKKFLNNPINVKELLRKKLKETILEMKKVDVDVDTLEKRIKPGDLNKRKKKKKKRRIIE